MNILTVYLFCFLSITTATVLRPIFGYDCGGWAPTRCPEGFHCDYLLGDRGYCHADGKTDHACGKHNPCPEGFHCDYGYGYPSWSGDGRCHEGAFHPTDKPSVGQPRSE